MRATVAFIHPSLALIPKLSNMNTDLCIQTSSLNFCRLVFHSKFARCEYLCTGCDMRVVLTKDRHRQTSSEGVWMQCIPCGLLLFYIGYVGLFFSIYRPRSIPIYGADISFGKRNELRSCWVHQTNELDSSCYCISRHRILPRGNRLFAKHTLYAVATWNAF